MNAASARPIIGVTYSSAELAEFHHWRLMFQSIVAAGGTPLAIDCAFPHPGMAQIVGHLDGLILSGGGDIEGWRYGAAKDPLVDGVNADRDTAELVAFDASQSLGLPVLAICRGAQLVNVHLGGSLIIDLERDRPSIVRHRGSEESMDKSSHNVEVAHGSLLATWCLSAGSIGVNSQHHQGFDRLGTGLVACGHATDGLVEAFERGGGVPLLGVQWHPEVLWTTEPHSMNLLTSFAAHCQRQGRRSIA
jgi:putative glutamine amidotransferase